MAMDMTWPNLAPLALLACASRVRGRGRSPAQFQEETAASSAKSGWS